MEKKRPMKSKGPMPKSEMKKKYVEEDDDETEESHDADPFMQGEELLQSQYEPMQQITKEEAPQKKTKRQFNSEPVDILQTKTRKTLPSKFPIAQMEQPMRFAQQQYKMNSDIFDEDTVDFPQHYSPLPPITTTQNLHEILGPKSSPLSIKAFKDYFLQHANLTGIIECDASVLLTDVHLYELTQFEWPYLDTIRIRACPHLTPFAMNYIQMIIDKHKDRQIKVDVDLVLHAHNSIQNQTDLTNKTITQLENFFGKRTETSIGKVLIYHVNSSNGSTLSSQQMLTCQMQKSKENSPMLINYFSSTHAKCQVAILECANPMLFKELCVSFHPQIIYLVVSSVEDVLKCFFSMNTITAFTILQRQQIRLIINSKEFEDHFLSDIHTQLNGISKSAHDLYSQYIDTDLTYVSENDDFRRNHYLSTLLHVQTKCDLLTKKLTKDHCLHIKQTDPSFISNYLINDAVKYCNSLYTLNIGDLAGRKVLKTNEPVSKLAEELTVKAKQQNTDSVTRNSTKLAQLYFTHRLITDEVLDVYSKSSSQSYFITDIEWFCRTINNLFNSEMRTHRKTQRILEHTIGTNLRLFSRRDLKKLNINEDEMDFLQWLFNSWNLAYPLSIDEQNESNIFILFNSISSEPPIALNTVWAKSWPANEYESTIHFHLLHPCDASILFYLYNLFPSQKLILASNKFLLIQEGAIEILVQYENTSISVTFRTLNLNASKDESVGLIIESFEYVIREYYVIIWAFLFKLDYAFKIETKDKDSTNPFEAIIGNELMHSKWAHLAVYHYSPAPTLNSPCTVCGLRPTANKSLYNACTTLSPARCTTKNMGSVEEDSDERDSSFSILGFNEAPLAYTGKYSMRPDGCSSFEVLFLNSNPNDQESPSPIVSSIEIGCLMNNFDVKENEKIVFEYGGERKQDVKTRNIQQLQQPDAVSHLDAIRNFGGFKGLKSLKDAKEKSKEVTQEFYNGLRLRVDILYTQKSNTYEFIFSINDIPWSSKTIKRKSTQTMFQSIIQSPGIHKTNQTMNLIISHNKPALDNALIPTRTPSVGNNPWQVGMRLEAKDRKNPSILAIANIIEVYEDSRIRINFDGWTSAFDYTVETDNADLHPCGYWEYVQRVIYKNPNSSRSNSHFTFTRYDKPKSYDGPFSWRNYLTEKDQNPVPFECFNYLQTEGMTVDYFPHGITKTAFTSCSCRHYYNVRVKYHKMNTFIQNEIVDKILYEHDMEINGPGVVTSPGAILLPTPLDMSILANPSIKQFQNPSNFLLHMTCNHRSLSPLDSTTIVSGAHLLDTKGDCLKKDNLTPSIITICMLTAIDLARKQKRPIAPSTSELISNNNNSFDNRIIDFYIRRWLDLSAYLTCFHSSYFYTKPPSRSSAEMTRESLYACYSDQDLFAVLKNNLGSIDITFSTFPKTYYQNQFGKYGECYYCSLLRNDEIKDKTSEISFQKRLDMIGNYAPSIFYLELTKQEKNELENRLILNDEFFLRFNGLEIIDITNVIIDRFQLHHKNIRTLTNLTYLSLDNNDLSVVDVDFQYLNKLVSIKLSQNPFESLPLNIFASSALQNVELFQLGRLIEIDPNVRFSSELKTLLITESILITLPQMLDADSRSHLKTLTLNGVPWWGVDGMSVNEVVKYESFENKFIPFLDNQQLTTIYHMYDEDANGVLSYSEINLMNAHIYRYIPRLRPSLIKRPNTGRTSTEPSNMTKSDNSEQESSSNDPSGFPRSIFLLENLTELSLEYQGIKSVPDAIKNLRSLARFNLNYCVELETISAEVGLLLLNELNLNGCVSLKTPPMEITRRGHRQTMAFLQRLGSGSTPCKRTKLMLVGLGGAGKTSLVRAFLSSHSNSAPAVTDGIDIVKWKVPLDVSDDFLEFSVWDFAGQSVYYHTHQFFLAKKAVYVLAWNIRLGAEHAGLDFWLSSICCHAPNAPIFVVGTHMDQVSRVDIRQDDLKRRYPQIAGFFNVSTHTGDNVAELTDTIIKTTLALPYMDEQIPRAWLNFETLIAQCDADILEYTQATNIAHNAGVFEPDEVLQAIQFLHDLGSLQYFSSEHLKHYVVINPQWIVNVMACIVSIKDSPVKNGRLHHSDIGVIWRDYDEHLHPWILKLTEAFDLTFPIPDQSMNLVPCLLPEEEPKYTWSEDSNDPEKREMKVIYTFNYLPAGLFNRAQVRLFQFSDKSTIWRYGSLLTKNNHRAVIIRSDDEHISIKIQGIRPDNMLFLIHEVFEGLVNESFFGVTYDIAFPCPDCLELGTNEPWQFSSSLINRAIELKSPSIQCHRFFHIASVTDLQALIPPDSKSNYDLHLEYSVRDLKSYKQNVAVDIVYIYPSEHVPTASEIEKKVDPRKIQDDLTKRGLKIWTPDSMNEFRIENHYLVIKQARSVIFGISTELIQNPKNKNLLDALQTILNILRKPIIPVLFGNDMEWKKTDVGIVLSDKLYVNMQSPERYNNRILELIDLIEQEKGDAANKKQQLRDQPSDIFISYCWSNSHDAVSKGTKPTATSLGWGDPRVLKDYLEGRELNIWMDITRLGKSGVLHDIVHGLKNTRLVVACVSDEYAQSEICRNEFLFAKNTLRLPVVLAVFGGGDEWRVTEVGMRSLTCSQVNFQFENPTAFEDIYNLIQEHLPKRSPYKEVPSNANTSESAGKTTAAYQELFELTQRKFLRLTSGFAETMTARAYPRLFALDFMDEKKEKSAQELARMEIAAEMNTQRQHTGDDDNHARDLEAERQRDEEVLRTQKKSDTPIVVKEKAKPLCIRALCENEENWHPAGNPFEITDKVILQNSASYLTRIMLLLKQSDLELNILNSEEGEVELQKLAELANTMNMEVKDAYGYLRRCIMDCDSEEKYSGLKQCLMPSGKVLWLCEEHEKQPRVILVTGSVAGGYTRPQAEEKSEIVKALAKLNERIANNELTPPSVKVPSHGNTVRLPSAKQSNRGRQSHRYSRQESISIKSQQQNNVKINGHAHENSDEVIQAMMNDELNINRNSTQDELSVINSTDCSVM